MIEELSTIEQICFLLEETTHPVALLNEDGAVVEYNKNCYEKMGLKRTNDIYTIIDESSVQVWRENFTKVLEKGRTNFTIHISSSVATIKKMNVRLLYFKQSKNVVAFFNESPSLQKKQESLFDKIINQSDSLVFMVDSNGKIQQVSNLTKEYFDLPRNYFLGSSVRNLLLLLGKSNQDIKKYLTEAHEKGFKESIESYKSSGQEVKYYKAILIYDKKSSVYLIKFNDVTESILLQEQLDHQRSLAEVGQLAANVVHEIRNPLTTLKGFTQLLRNTPPEESEKYLTVIDEEIIRMETVLNELLVLSKPGSTKKTYISLFSLVDSVKQVVTPTTNLEGIDINIQKDLNFNDALVLGDEAKLKQVVLNLFKNAYEAMEAGGVLTVELTQDYTGTVQLAISDTGKGIESTQIEQVFSPFFTTRQEGTGLGLPFVLRTVEEHGGAITVESEKGKGTTFKISFPEEIVEIIEEVGKKDFLTGIS